MSELTIHTGSQGAQHTIHVAWFDENNVPQTTTLLLHILAQDKPRTLEIAIDGAIVAHIAPGGRWVDW